MPSDSSIMRAATALAIILVLAVFFLAGGMAGILSAFSSFFVALGVLVVIVLFFIEGGHEKVGLGMAIASVLVIGGLLVGASAGLTSLVALAVVVGACLLFVYGFANNPEKHLFTVLISAGVIIFLGWEVLSSEFNLAAVGIVLFLVSAAGMTAVISKLSEEDSGFLWAVFAAALATVGGLALVFAGFPGFIAFAFLILAAVCVFLAFPDVAAADGAIKSWIGMGAALLVVFFLAAMQGIIPGMLRSFSLLIMLAGLVTVALFLRISDKEIPGITAAGLMAGTILTLVGLYMVLF
jgi:hypothetical protein